MSTGLKLEPFTLRVKDLHNQTHPVFCMGRDHTVEYIKFALSQETGIDRNSIALVAHGRTLCDNLTLADESITPHSRVSMVINLRSGLRSLR